MFPALYCDITDCDCGKASFEANPVFTAVGAEIQAELGSGKKQIGIDFRSELLRTRGLKSPSLWLSKVAKTVFASLTDASRWAI